MNFYLEVAIKLCIGLFSLVLAINVSGKGNLAPTAAIDQVCTWRHCWRHDLQQFNYHFAVHPCPAYLAHYCHGSQMVENKQYAGQAVD